MAQQEQLLLTVTVRRLPHQWSGYVRVSIAMVELPGRLRCHVRWAHVVQNRRLIKELHCFLFWKGHRLPPTHRLQVKVSLHSVPDGSACTSRHVHDVLGIPLVLRLHVGAAPLQPQGHAANHEGLRLLHVGFVSCSRPPRCDLAITVVSQRRTIAASLVSLALRGPRSAVAMAMIGTSCDTIKLCHCMLHEQ